MNKNKNENNIKINKKTRPCRNRLQHSRLEHYIIWCKTSGHILYMWPQDVTSSTLGGAVLIKSNYSWLMMCGLVRQPWRQTWERNEAFRAWPALKGLSGRIAKGRLAKAVKKPSRGTSVLAFARFPEGIPERMGKRRLLVKSSQSSRLWHCDSPPSPFRAYLQLNQHEVIPCQCLPLCPSGCLAHCIHQRIWSLCILVVVHDDVLDLLPEVLSHQKQHQAMISMCIYIYMYVYVDIYIYI